MDQNDLTVKKDSRQLRFHMAPVVVTGMGGFLVVFSMFLPHLSYGSHRIVDNVMIRNEPLTLICCVAAILAIQRFWSVGSKASAHFAIWAGLWFLIRVIYDANSSYLNVPYSSMFLPFDTTRTQKADAGIGLWIAGIGCALVLFGGLMMRFPQLTFGLFPRGTHDVRPPLESQTKICPKCAETIKLAAVVCRYCGHQFTT